MLFPLNPATQRCQAFIVLNQLLLDFLEACVEADDFSEALFFDNTLVVRPVNTGTVCWDNVPTRGMFERLWLEIEKLNQAEREALFNEINSKQDIFVFFTDKTLDFPVIPAGSLYDAFSALSSHLFKRTKTLTGIRDYCGGETINAYYHQYCVDNGRVCSVCGTKRLAQTRAGVEPEKQWLSDFDHLFCQSKYPMFSIHPNNILPICTVCNRDAKRSKDLLLQITGRGVSRRLSFLPYSESCENLIEVKLIENDEHILELKVNFNSDDVNTIEKLTTWDEVYLIKSRVEGCKNPFITWLDGECLADDLEHFKDRLSRLAQPLRTQIKRSEPWKYWHNKLYSWIIQQGNEFIESLWEMIEHHRDDDNFEELFEV